MFVKRLKLSAGIWLVLGIFLGFLGGMGFSKITIDEKPKVDPGYIPGRAVDITIDQSQQEELFAQLQKFAEKWRYAIRIAPVFEGSDDLHVGLWRTDMKVIGVYLSSSGELKLGFSDTESTRPTPAQYFEEEIQDLKSFMDEIPNSTFTFWTPPAPPN